MPFPRTGIVSSWLPARQNPARARLGFHNSPRIAGVSPTSRGFDKRNIFAGNLSRHSDHSFHRKSPSVSPIVDKLFVILESLQSKEVSAGKIGNVNVITDAGAVRRVVIIAIGCHESTMVHCRGQADWYQMRLWRVRLAEITRCSSRVEITKAGVTKMMNSLKPH